MHLLYITASLSLSPPQFFLMGSYQDQAMTSDGEEFLKAVQLSNGYQALYSALRAAVELDIFEIMMANVGIDGHISPSQIASHLPTKNPQAAAMLDRMLRLLASFSVLNCTLVADGGPGGGATRLYGLTPMCKYFVRDQHGISLLPSLLFTQHRVMTETWRCLKDAIMEGGVPFNKAHGMHVFEYVGKDSGFSEVLNQALFNNTAINMKGFIETYKGFEGLKEVVDVGGGFGATLGGIVSKYPHIKGINFDLPTVIKDAPHFPGVEHVGGDMFETVPKGEVILLKNVLHDWGDDQCLKLLKNCWGALPESGKVIVVELILPEFPETDIVSQNAFQFDMGMLAMFPGGRERTEREIEGLARGAGFAASKLVCTAQSYGILEFYKNV